MSGRTGTLMYMAPEVYLKQPYNDKADVYSFSIIAYELLHRYMMISATDGSLEECMVSDKSDRSDKSDKSDISYFRFPGGVSGRWVLGSA